MGPSFPICQPIAESASSSISRGNLTDQVHGYRDWFDKLLTEGRDGYLVTVMFTPISGSPQARLGQMQSDLIRMYGRLAKRMIRDPRTSSQSADLPVAIFFPDSGYYSHTKRGSRDAWINGGLHLHGCIAAKTTARCPETLDIHFQERQDLYRVGCIRSIDVRHVMSDPDYVMDYALKALKRRRHELADVLILPMSPSERF